jgi:hypothetical protein
MILSEKGQKQEKKGGIAKAKKSSKSLAKLEQSSSKALAKPKQSSSKGLANSSKALANSSRGEERREEERKEEKIVKDQKATLPKIQTQIPMPKGDTDFSGDFEMFRGFAEMSMRLQNAKFKIQSFWDHWESLDWKDTNGKRISLRQKANYAFQNFEKEGKSAYFGDGPKKDFQSRLKADREELQRDLQNGGPFQDEPIQTPHLRIQA